MFYSPYRKPCGIAVAGVAVLGIVGLAPFCVADSLTTRSGEVYEGRVLHYDEFSYIILLDGGGKVVIPREEVEQVETDRKRRLSYSRRADVVLSVEQVKQDDSPQRLILARLKDPGEQGQEYGLMVEAQTLLYVFESEERYGDACRTLYEWRGAKYELEYEWEKDLLVRRQRVPGYGVNVKVLGARGEGLETLKRAARGRIREERSLMQRMYEPARRPVERKQRGAPSGRSSW